MNILTIIVVAFLTIVTVRGFVRGFSRSVLSILFLIFVKRALHFRDAGLLVFVVTIKSGIVEFIPEIHSRNGKDRKGMKDGSVGNT